ncbi:hypothetical protein ACETU7_27510 [Rhodococcus sp. 3Y1]
MVECLRAGVPATALWVAVGTESDDRLKESVQLAADAGISILEVPAPIWIASAPTVFTRASPCRFRRTATRTRTIFSRRHASMPSRRCSSRWTTSPIPATWVPSCARSQLRWTRRRDSGAS